MRGAIIVWSSICAVDTLSSYTLYQIKSMNSSNGPIYDEIPPSTTDDQTTSSASNLDNTTTMKDKDKDKTKPAKSVKVEWSPENEMIMVEWCDVAQCYKWMNSRSHVKYSKLQAWYTIPAIILSTLSGTASFAQASIPDSFKEYAPAVIGSINIFIGILTTIQQYLKISELNEAHRISAISWDKYARNIRIELAKRPEERCDAGSFIKQCRGEFDRLMETSPDITEPIINLFYAKFSGKKGTDKRRRFEQLRKPDICDSLTSANETRHKWYLELESARDIAGMSDEEDDTSEMVRTKNGVIHAQQQKLDAAAYEIKRREEYEQNTIIRQVEHLKTIQREQAEAAAFATQQTDFIKKYITSFENIYDRKPLHDEISDNIVGQIEPAILEKFLEQYVPM
jgi:hypothetical protein